MKISVTRALVEIKSLDKRILKSINEIDPVAIQVGERFPSAAGQTKEDFINNAKADYQSINDLIRRRQHMKSALVKSNALTAVKIGDKLMTVAEAIERKNSIELEKELLKTLQKRYADKVSALHVHNEMVRQRLDQLLLATYSKESTKVKADEYDAVAKPFMLNNEAVLVDPLKVKDAITEIEGEINLFEQEVDIALTEANARTEIEV